MAEVKPETVKRPGTEPEPAPPTNTDALLELVRALAASNQLSVERIAEISAAAAAAAHAKVHPTFENPEYEDRSTLNPLGERSHPRPKLLREILWVGYRLQESELKREEIDLLNQLRPGVFKEGFFRVTDMDPGIPNGRLLVMFPCLTPDQRMNLARYDRGNGMVDILREMVPTAA